MLLNLTELSSEPLHEQISRQVAEKITMDELAAGFCTSPGQHAGKRTESQCQYRKTGL